MTNRHNLQASCDMGCDFRLYPVCLLMALAIISGCSGIQKGVFMKDIQKHMPENTIVSAATGQPVSYDEMLSDFLSARVIYIGEVHTNPVHHQIQRDIIKDMHTRYPGLDVGIEMVDTTYQSILDQWSAGNLTPEIFREKIHWYANWRYPYDLYAAIFELIQLEKIRLIGLNLPFHVPPKIAVGGIDSLMPDDARYLPAKIDLGEPSHRAYIESIFQIHNIRGRENFDYFYMAQCAWEDAMAETISRNLGQSKLIVLIGNGHIIQKFGVPDRAFERTQAPFKTLYLISSGGEASLKYGDYIWITDDGRKTMPHSR